YLSLIAAAFQYPDNSVAYMGDFQIDIVRQRFETSESFSVKQHKNQWRGTEPVPFFAHGQPKSCNIVKRHCARTNGY
ncbi:MAG: hypothetical protein LBL05_04265, partial [Synergistaceae bacterium]|nr:hypothetical protein [Synergistaceae bacterium]